MTDIPPDIRSAAIAVVDRGYNVGLIDAVAEALMAEREAQKERDAKIAEDNNHWPQEGDYIASLIRSPDTPTPQEETLLEPPIIWGSGTLRVCPMRDATCPHGMSCPYVDGYTCKLGWQTSRRTNATG